MSNPTGIAEIIFPPDQGWNLPSAGHDNPLRFWAHIHFDDDEDWGKKLWTVFVEPEIKPVAAQTEYKVKLFFVAPSAPHHLIKVGSKFKLCIGDLDIPTSTKAQGKIFCRSDN